MDHTLIEFMQYIDISLVSRYAHDIFYSDFECTTDDDYHKPYICCIKKCDIYFIKTFIEQSMVKKFMVSLYQFQKNQKSYSISSL